MSNPLTLEQLQPFCSTDEKRQLLHKPFSRGEWTYATDGKIMIRVPLIEGVMASDIAAEQCFITTPAQEVPIPDFIPEPVTRECQKCRGEGECRCLSCGSDFGCKSCDGRGSITEDPPVLIGTHHVRASHLRLIKPLPGIKLLFPTVLGPNALFTFDGGQGVLGPMTN